MSIDPLEKKSFDFLKRSNIDSEDFGIRLMTSGVVSRGDIQTTWRLLSKPNRNAYGLAQALAERRKLTPFQAWTVIHEDTFPLVLGRYVIEESIGEGGMGRVYVALHRAMKRRVAIKLIAGDIEHQKEVQIRFDREIQASARLTHPNIVVAYDAGVARGMHYLVMEYVQGIDLYRRVQNGGVIAPLESLRIIAEAATGLAYVHDRGVIHRDIKPSNILIDSTGAIKILDLGLARIQSGLDSSLTQGLTSTGTTVGTLDYLAPEQAEDSSLADARSDVYSLGCTLYFLLVGQPLYLHDKIYDRLVAHRTAAIPSLPSYLIDCGGPLIDELLAKMVAKRPSDRFASMHEVTIAIQSLLEKLQEPRLQASPDPVTKPKSVTFGSTVEPAETDYQIRTSAPSREDTVVLRRPPKTISESVHPKDLKPMFQPVANLPKESITAAEPVWRQFLGSTIGLILLGGIMAIVMIALGTAAAFWW